jgi:hypothetical protein
VSDNLALEIYERAMIAAKEEYERRVKAAFDEYKLMTRPDNSPVVIGAKHGTQSAYKRGCRCRACRDCVAADMRIRRAKLKGVLTPDDPRHGTLNAATNYGCSCQLCLDANNGYQRQARSRA